MKISYGIKSMVEDGYQFNYDFDYKNIDKSKIGFQFGHDIKANRENQEITIKVFSHIVYDGKTIAKEGVMAIFEINPFDEVIASADEDGIKVKEPNLIDTFINVAIGAMRGMLVKNLKGTPIEGCVLPLIPMNIIRENVIKKKTEK